MRFAAAALLLHTAPNLAAPASGGASAGLPQQHEPTHPGHGQAARVTRASLQHDAAVSLVTFALPLALILLTEVLKDSGRLSTPASRKLLHIATGPLFVLTWSLYSSTWAARCFAALLPGLMALRFALAGLGITREPRLVAGTARTGRREELLEGPLLYGLTHTALTLVAWRSNPAGVAGVAALCAGDGLADVVGRRWGVRRLPHSKHKTWLGSAACFLAAWGATAALLQHFRRQGLMLEGVSTAQLLAGSAASSLVAAVVESLPLSAADNITMPLAAALTALWWFAGAGSSMVPAAAAAAAKVALE